MVEIDNSMEFTGTPARWTIKGVVEVERDGVWVELTHTEAHTLLFTEPYNWNLKTAVEWADAIKWITEDVMRCMSVQSN